METPDGLHQISDLLVMILQTVGRVSAKDACRAACASKQLCAAFKEPSVMQALNLSDFVADTTLVERYPHFFNLALSSDNPHALYLHGMRTIAIDHDVQKSLQFFNKASKAGIDQATLMVAVIVTALGHYPTAKEMLERVVGWRSRLHYMIELGEEVSRTKMGMQSATADLLPNVFKVEDFPRCRFKHRLMGCEECYLFVQYQLLRFQF